MTILPIPTLVNPNRLASLIGRSRVTLMARYWQGDIVADALQDVGRPKPQPMFRPERAEEIRQILAGNAVSVSRRA